MDWQPIETAPKDGSVLFGYGTRHSASDIAEDEKAVTKIRYGQYGRNWHWYEAAATPRGATGFTPTHWLPIPPPPSDASRRRAS